MTLLNILIITVIIVNCFNVKQSSPPNAIWVEDKSKILDNDISNLHIVNSENQNSNQILFTNNGNNFYNLNNSRNKFLNKPKNIHTTGISYLHYKSVKNFITYNQYFLNLNIKEIFESKINSIIRNKLILHNTSIHTNTVKELNDNEFQQNILIKCMDFNSSMDSSLNIGYKSKKDRFMSNNKKGINHKQSLKEKTRKSSEIKVYSEEESSGSENYKKPAKLNGMLQISTKEKSYDKHMDSKFSSENIEINDYFQNNYETFKTNIGSEEKYKLSTKEIDIFKKSIIKDNLTDHNNSSNDRLVLKENNFDLHKESSKNIMYHQTSLFSRSKKNSSNEVDDYKFSKTEGIDMKDFLFTDQKIPNKSSKNVIKNVRSLKNITFKGKIIFFNIFRSKQKLKN